MAGEKGKSYNGAPVPAGAVQTFSVQGRRFTVVSEARYIFEYYVRQFDARVESIVDLDTVPDDWSGAIRQNRNSNNWSCHASFTAVDLNATRHPNGKAGTFTKAQYAEIDKILDEVDGALTVGMPGRKHGWKPGSKPDEMHAELSHWNIARLTAINEKCRLLLKSGRTATSTEDDDMTPQQAAQLAELHSRLLVPGQPFAWSQANTNRLDKLVEVLKDIRDQFNVPGAPYQWNAALNNKIDELNKMVDELTPDDPK